MWNEDPRVKPPFGAAEIDWAHPLSRGLVTALLFNEGGGLPSDLARGTQATAFPGSYGTSNAGPGIRFAGSQELDLIWLGGGFQMSLSVGLFWDQYVNLYAKLAVAGADGQFTWTHQQGDGVTTTQLRTDWVAGAVHNIGEFTRPSAGVSHRLTGTFDRTASGVLGQQLYTDGASVSGSPILTGDTSNGSTIPFDSNPTMKVMPDATSIATLDYLYCHNRKLGPDEILWFYAEPYAMLRPIVRRYHLVTTPTTPTTSSVVFRTTLSQLGTRGGTRQPHAWSR